MIDEKKRKNTPPPTIITISLTNYPIEMMMEDLPSISMLDTNEILNS